MILVEECRLRLDDPVDEFLPELANRKVLRRLEALLDDVLPAKRAITLRDLLTFRWGFGAVMVWPPAYPIQKAMEAAGLMPFHGLIEVFVRGGGIADPLESVPLSIRIETGNPGSDLGEGVHGERDRCQRAMAQNIDRGA
jgi:CubicO group peptidase (beta-lactamase class C family)